MQLYVSTHALRKKERPNDKGIKKYQIKQSFVWRSFRRYRGRQKKKHLLRKALRYFALHRSHSCLLVLMFAVVVSSLMYSHCYRLVCSSFSFCKKSLQREALCCCACNLLNYCCNFAVRVSRCSSPFCFDEISFSPLSKNSQR